MATANTQDRRGLVRRGRQLEYFTIAYNSAEGLVSIVAGIVAGFVSLIGFGLNSLIEVTSGAAMLPPECSAPATTTAILRLWTRHKSESSSFWLYYHGPPNSASNRATSVPT